MSMREYMLYHIKLHVFIMAHVAVSYTQTNKGNNIIVICGKAWTQLSLMNWPK